MNEIAVNLTLDPIRACTRCVALAHRDEMALTINFRTGDETPICADCYDDYICKIQHGWEPRPYIILTNAAEYMRVIKAIK